MQDIKQMTNPKEVLEKIYQNCFMNGVYGIDELGDTYNIEKDITKEIISSQIATLTSLLEAIPEDEEHDFKVWKIDDMRAEAVNQERQRQRQSLQLTIKEWTELK